MSRFRALSSLLSLTVAFSSSCDGCRDSKPYTPFTLHDPTGSPTPPSVAPPAPVASTLVPFPKTREVLPSVVSAEGKGLSWPLEEGTPPARPREGFVFQMGLEFHDPERHELVAWAAHPDGSAELLKFRKGAPPATLLRRPPEFVATAAACPSKPELVVVDETSVLVSDCPSCSELSSAWCYIALVDREGDRPLVEVRTAPPPAGEVLRVNAERKDEDGDGHRDLLLRFTLAEGDATATANITYTDRTAGLSRNPSEPDASILGQTQKLLELAAKRADAKFVRPRAELLHRLRESLCEGPRKLVSLSTGPVPCDDLRGIEQIFFAQAMAAGTQGLPRSLLQAAAPILNADEPLGSKAELERLVDKYIPRVPAKVVFQGPEVRHDTVFPYRFVSEKLMIETPEGQVEVAGDPPREATHEANHPDDAKPEGDSAQGGPPNYRFLGIEQTCSESGLVAWLVASDAPEAKIRAPLPPSFPVGREGFPSLRPCAPRVDLPFSVAPPTVPQTKIDFVLGAAWFTYDVGLRKITAIAEEQLPAELASVPLAYGKSFYVAEGAILGRRWQAPEFERAKQCIFDNRSKLACTVDGRAVIFEATRPPKTSKAKKKK